MGTVLAGGGAYAGYRMMMGDGVMQRTTFVVMMQDDAFAPREITIPAGGTVTWMNHDSVDHTVTSDDPAGPLDSPLYGRMGTWSFTFGSPGTFEYHCDPHAVRMENGAYAGMTGVVVVKA